MKSKYKLYIFIMSFLLLFVGLYAWRVKAVNEKYPASKKTLISVGNSVDLQGVEFSVNNGEWVNVCELQKDDPLHQAIEQDIGNNEIEIMALILEFTFFNRTSEEIIVDMTAVNIESGNDSRPFGKLINYYSQDGIYLHIPPQNTVIKKGIQTFLSVHFTHNEWSHLKERSFYFVTSLYPEKIMVEIPIKDHS